MTRILTEVIANVGPVLSTVAAVFLAILGVLVILKPVLLAWLIGLGLILLGVALFAMVFVPTGQTRW